MATLRGTPEQNLRVPTVPDRELDGRKNDGIEIGLWHRPDTEPPELYVTVNDTKSGIKYAPIEVPRPDQAKHYFTHAMTYVGDTAVNAAVTQEGVPQG